MGRDTVGSAHGDTLMGPRNTRDPLISTKITEAGVAPPVMLPQLG